MIFSDKPLLHYCQVFGRLFLFVIGVAHTQVFNDFNSLNFSKMLYWTQIFIDNNPGLQFLKPDWNVNDFHYYVLQDGLYLQNYPLVYARIPTLCSSQSKTNALYNQLSKTTFNLSDYEKHFEFKYSSNDMIFSEVLNKYFEHYAKQHTCIELISAMVPCICLYPTIIATLYQNINQFHPLVRKWMQLNKSPGNACKIAQNVLIDYGISNAPPLASFNKSIQFEYSLFAVKSQNRLNSASTAENIFLSYQFWLFFIFNFFCLF
ncbi:uncharacterized protein LOC136089409 [Hydra vulgaris]|uniref:Uncharacterized protein LOC136089409 n=1 Tax=Hydra vulgaris TaxID=6087 RepID=A0ABM4DAQ5_HYDVU